MSLKWRAQKGGQSFARLKGADFNRAINRGNSALEGLAESMEKPRRHRITHPGRPPAEDLGLLTPLMVYKNFLEPIRLEKK
jgi:hypothetical protein